MYIYKVKIKKKIIFFPNLLLKIPNKQKAFLKQIFIKKKK